jgi:PAS domain S-box-containing protein
MKKEKDDQATLRGNSTEALAPASGEESEVFFNLRLYVSGMTPYSRSAIEQVKKICEEHLQGHYELGIIDVYQQPVLAREAQIIAAPTLVKESPPPLRKFIGDMSQAERILLWLGLQPKPADQIKSRVELLVEIEELNQSLEETREMLRAIRSGEVDSLVVLRPAGEQVFSLQGAEHPYRVLVETMNEGAATIAADGTIAYCNRCLANLLQVPLEKILGSTLQSFVAPVDYPTFTAALKKCTKEYVKEEISLLTGAGSQVTVLLSCGAGTMSGSPGVSVVLTDISQRKRAEEKILRLNRLYALLSGANKVIVHAADRDSLFQEICRVAVAGGFRMAWIGLVDEGAGTIKPVACRGVDDGFLDQIQISTGEAPQGMGSTGTAVREGGLSVVGDILNDPRCASFAREAEKRGYRSSAAIPLKLRGKAIAVLTLYSIEKEFFNSQFADLLLEIGMDISFALDNFDHEFRRRETERFLKDEITERFLITEDLRGKELLLIQQGRMAALGEMIGNIAHQWRQPMNVLGLKVQEIGFTYKLGGFSEEFLDTNVAQIMEILQHMSQTIDDFRDFTSPDKEKRLFSAETVVAKTLAIVGESYKQRGVAIDVSISGEAQINGYVNEYSQVLLNLLINAKDAFEERQTSDARITVRSWTEAGKVVLTITDNAGGIKEEIIGKVFDPYFTTKEQGKGTGIGLFMSKTIVEKHMGGRLSVRNVAGGAEFRIEV